MYGILKFDVIAGWKKDGENVIGTCFVNNYRGKETISFEYNKQWLIENPNFVLDPALDQFIGRQYSPFETAPFGFLSDLSPDRWGRKLMEKKEIEDAKNEKRPKKTLMESDYILMISDECRQGGIRLRDKDGNYYTSTPGFEIPPITDIRVLEAASLNLENHSGNISRWISRLIDPGSSLGGARPKANVREMDGSLWIAKFPSKNDERDVGSWEMVAHDLAVLCGLNVPDANLLRLSEIGSTFLSKRFDREVTSDGTLKRLHFVSAMTMLNKTDGDSNISSYLDIASIIEKIEKSSVEKDLRELWHRIVFNVCISNTDDHLRNHGFLLNEKEEWTLSPVYDVNPNPEKNTLSLLIDFSSHEKDLSLVLNVCDFFRIPYETAVKEVKKIYDNIQNNWRKLATKYGIPKREQDYMEICFNDPEREEYIHSLE